MGTSGTYGAAGVDGCRAGWVVVHAGRAWVAPDFTAVLAALPPGTVVGVDIPVGLLDEWVAGGRDADRAARAAMPGGGSSVFSAPPRAAFGCSSLPEVQARGCRMTLQALHIMRKVAEVDALMSPALQSRVVEVHPEMGFRTLNGGAPLDEPKRRAAGRAQRRALLEGAGIRVPGRPRAGEAEDDVLDACVAAWSAWRVSDGTAIRVPDPAPVDSRGLRMQISW